MDHKINLAPTCGGQRGPGVGKEIRTATAALDSRSKWVVETEVGVGQEENADRQRRLVGVGDHEGEQRAEDRGLDPGLELLVGVHLGPLAAA